jgi:hypothetical protein
MGSSKNSDGLFRGNFFAAAGLIGWGGRCNRLASDKPHEQQAAQASIVGPKIFELQSSWTTTFRVIEFDGSDASIHDPS